MRVEAHGVGAAESHADSYLIVRAGSQRLALIGNLAFDGVHSYTANGHTGRWLDVLDGMAGELKVRGGQP